MVAVDVSASVGQGDGERTAWASVRAWADSLLALTGPGDRVALAAVADGVVGWWTGEPTALRRRLSGLEPTARASDWPRVLAALEARAVDDTETYLLTDGSRGARPPSLSASSGARSGYRALRVWEGAGARNRALSGVRWTGTDRVELVGRVWGGDDGPQVAGRRIGDALTERAVLPMDGSAGAAAWTVGDSATFALAGSDGLPSDDRLPVARGAVGAYRVARVVAPDEPPESGPLFWEAAIRAAERGAVVERAGAARHERDRRERDGCPARRARP